MEKPTASKAPRECETLLLWAWDPGARTGALMGSRDKAQVKVQGLKPPEGLGYVQKCEH